MNDANPSNAFACSNAKKKKKNFTILDGNEGEENDRFQLLHLKSGKKGGERHNGDDKKEK